MASFMSLQQPSNSPEQQQYWGSRAVMSAAGLGPRLGHTYWYVHDKRNIQTPGGSKHFLSLRQVSPPANS